MAAPFIVSGGPGAGKTTLLAQLSKRGFVVLDEVPRRLIEEQSAKENGILPWHDLPRFAALCFEAMREQKRLACQQETRTFLDRAMPDIIGYLTLAGESIPQEYVEACLGYQKVAFLCKPERSIYVQDAIRPYPFEQALAIHQALEETYRWLGFEVIDVPLLAVEARTQWLVAKLGALIE
ncbi:AAA family ATPase [Vibrio sp. SM6]|uniref:AAA family ATPase n=1 Tax=Vibrio agarilyticus TaxID=2726741 RepID=A0A7X8TRV4_9VIBR|nr:AAA family ATPase [Vibrio agarilyticus]NLS13671.1 AAA family ATPase [Vibrio agarilyticus]